MEVFKWETTKLGTWGDRGDSIPIDRVNNMITYIAWISQKQIQNLKNKNKCKYSGLLI